jgi:hypothetical protein
MKGVSLRRVERPQLTILIGQLVVFMDFFYFWIVFERKKHP